MSVRNLKGHTGWRWTGYVKKDYCERCRKTTRLVVHHKDRDFSNNEDPLNLETLCRSCHREEHSSEISDRQRDPEVNARRGASISYTKQSRKGTKYPLVSEASKSTWANEESRAKLLSHLQSDKTRQASSERMKKLMNDPKHLEHRRKLKEEREARKLKVL
jgi:hypothetical protein